MLGDDTPEDAGVGRANALALEHNAGVAVEEWRVDDVGVAHHPADVLGRLRRIGLELRLRPRGRRIRPERPQLRRSPAAVPRVFAVRRLPRRAGECLRHGAPTISAQLSLTSERSSR